MNKTESKFWNSVDQSDSSGCWLWTAGKIGTGYGALYFPGGDQILAHRLSWQIHKGKIPKGMFVLHRCDNPACVNPEHLFLGDHGDNSRDCAAKGRLYLQNSDRKGSKHSRAKLSEEDIPAIFHAARVGNSQSAIAKIFGVKRSTIAGVLSKRNWSHVSKGETL